MVVEQEGGAVEADRRLAGARPALDDQQLVERGPDDHVLLGLDRRDDVAHLAGAGPVELGQERVGDAGGVVGAVGVVEVLVEQADELAVLEHEAAAEVEAQRVAEGGPVEGDGHPGAPVDHHRVAAVVLDVAAADVPLLAGLLVDAAEAQRSLGRLDGGLVATQLVPGGGGVDVGAGVDGEDVDQALHAGAHRLQVIVGAVEVALFVGQVGVHARAPGQSVRGDESVERAPRPCSTPAGRRAIAGRAARMLMHAGV